MEPSTVVHIAGTLTLIGVSALIATLGVTVFAKVCWWVVNSRESVMRASASALLAYIYFQFKYRYGEEDLERARDSTRIGDYIVKVEKIDGEE